LFSGTFYSVRKAVNVAMAKLTKKQQTFVDEYLIDLNATQAAIRAGYSPQTAKEIAAENLTKPNIADAILRAMAERSRRTGINADRILLEMAKIGFANIADVANMDEASVLMSASENDTAAIQSIKVKRIPTENGDIVEREVKMYDKTKALIEMGKHVGLFDTKLKISGSIPTVIRDDLGDDDDE
jgi:phage terminase small subunit